MKKNLNNCIKITNSAEKIGKHWKSIVQKKETKRDEKELLKSQPPKEKKKSHSQHTEKCLIVCTKNMSEREKIGKMCKRLGKKRKKEAEKVFASD